MSRKENVNIVKDGEFFIFYLKDVPFEAIIDEDTYIYDVVRGVSAALESQGISPSFEGWETTTDEFFSKAVEKFAENSGDRNQLKNTVPPFSNIKGLRKVNI